MIKTDRMNKIKEEVAAINRICMDKAMTDPDFIKDIPVEAFAAYQKLLRIADELGTMCAEEANTINHLEANVIWSNNKIKGLERKLDSMDDKLNRILKTVSK